MGRYIHQCLTLHRYNTQISNKNYAEFKKTYPTNILYTNEIMDIRTLYIITACTYIQFKLNTPTIKHSYPTRTSVYNQIMLPSINYETKARFIDYNGLKIYNLLPKEIRDIKTVHIFKQKCKTFANNNKNIFLGIINRL